MNKGLEAYERIVNNVHDIELDNSKQFESDMLIIAKELKRLEEIDDILNTGGGIWAENGIVSKELKTLEIIMKYGHFDFYTGELIVNVPVDKKEDYDLLKEVVRNE